MSIHDIDPGTKEAINVIVEIPKGSHNKYEIDEETGLLKLDRANYGPTPYPVEYGLVPQTMSEDGGATDVLIFSTYPIHPGVLVEVRPVALMEMNDSGEVDNKIIGVPVADRRWDDVRDVTDLNKHTLKELKNFFESYKQLKGEGYVVTIGGFRDKAAAEAEFEASRKRYEDKK